MHKPNFILLFIFYTFIYSFTSFELLSNGGSITKNQISQNPSWGFDSHTFTLEIFNENKYASDLTIIYIGQLTDDLDILWKRALTSDSNGSNKKSKKSSKYYQRPVSWLNNGTSKQMILGIAKNYSIKKIELKKYPDFNIRDDENLLDNIPNFFRGEPSIFTTSLDRFYFVSRSMDTEIFFTNTIDQGLDNLYKIGLSEYKLDLPITSIGITPDNSNLLIITYNEALSKIYQCDLTFNQGSDQIKNFIEIARPDSNLVFFDSIRDPYNDKRYILIGSNDVLDENSTAYAFIMNNDTIEGKFLFYRHKEESVNYISPVIQFYPKNNYIYFLKPTDGKEKILSYWDGTSTIETSMDMKNIRDFKISPDGEKFLVVTFKPEDLYIYSLIHD